MSGTTNGLGGDPWDGVVFDEEFVKAGRHEPPARTRESIARYGGQRTSWRQGALLEPAPARRRSRRHRRDWQLAAAVAAVIALAWFSTTRVSAAPEIPAAVAPAADPAIANSPPPGAVPSPTPITAAQPQTAQPAAASPEPAQPIATSNPSTAASTDVSGVTEFDAVGTCYLDPLTGEADVQLDPVDCTDEHNLELVSHRTAADDAVTYPDDRYWQEVVGAACREDLSAYLATPISAWPADLNAKWLIPKEESWAFGNRHIFCMARSHELVTTSVLDRSAHA